MGYLYEVREKAIQHKVAKDETLAGIAEKFKGAGNVPADLDWKEIALYNWATADEGAVTRALCERIGSAVSGAVNTAARPDSLVLDPAFGPTTGEPVLIPTLWKATGLAVNKQYKIEARRQTPATAIGITSLDKWFIPGHEPCDADYYTHGDAAFADAVQFEVYGSNYGKLKAWKDGLPEFAPLPGVPVYTAEATDNKIRDWKGLSKCAEGALSPDGHPLNVAFSPYTAVLRHAKKGMHTTARIDLEPFWVQFDDKNKLVPDSCAVKWKIQNAELTHGLLQIFARDGSVVYARGLDAADLKKGSVEWDGKDSTGRFVEPAKMPYRAQVQAHTGIDTEDGLALAAMHTEVRLYVHSGTHPEQKPGYDPRTDKTSLDFSIAGVWHKDAPPERAEGSLWTKYKLAEAGFHPGPVNDALDNIHFTTALHDFQRSVPVGGGAGSAPFLRMAIGGDNDETKDALASLELRRKRPLFGKPAGLGDTIGLNWRPGNWTVTTAGDFLLRLRDPSKRMIVWVDDRNWYTDGAYWEYGFYDATVVVSRPILDAVHNDPADLGGDQPQGRGSFEHRDKRVDCDVRDIARPWIPLQAGFRLLSRAQELDAEVGIPDEDLARHIRKAIGPLRVDWTFDEIEEKETVALVVENGNRVTQPLPKLDIESDALFSQLYHPATVRVSFPRPVSTRTRMALRWTLDKLKAEYDRKDVKRKSAYYNTPAAHGGIRPENSALATYFKAPFGMDGESLAPWTAKPDAARESICTAVHDAVGQEKDNLFESRLGRAGVYFHPSLIAGDGYQIRGQVRFDASGPYVSPNAAALAARYPKLPQAHTAEFRLWRKTSIRGFVKWSPDDDWSNPGPSCFDYLAQTGPDNWRAHYTACHVSIENELGAGDGELAQKIKTLFPKKDDYFKTVTSTLPSTDPRKDILNQAWMTLSEEYVWPWSGHANYGVPAPSVSPDFDGTTQALNRKLMCDHVSVAIRMSLELVKAIESQTGRMRGHVLVQYQTTPNCHFHQYVCTVCGQMPIYVQNAGTAVMGGKPCPIPLCAGVLTPTQPYVGRYACASRHVTSFRETSSVGGKYTGTKCKTCNLNVALFRVDNVPANKELDSKRGNKPTPGVPSPSCGFPVGVFWNITGDATLWAHELGHNRHYEHSADAMQDPKNSARGEHDNADNSYFKSGNEKDVNKGWDRACLMSYISQVRDKNWAPTYNVQRDLPAFCYKCALKNRGWRLKSLPLPNGDLQDLAGV